METFVSTVLGNLVSKSISFVVDKYRRQQQGVEENLQRLHSMLLWIQTTVKESDSRHITNQAMLQQLLMLREGMYKSYYMLDSFKYQMLTSERVKDEASEHSLALSRSNPAKRFCFESIIADMKEFVVFLSCYPPMRRQPYCKYLLLENCMFSRQSEQERVINFLQEAELPGSKSFHVLPIIGQARVGKSTLIEHVCHDERVRKYFSLIVLFSGNDFKDGNLVDLRDSGVIKHQNRASTGASLVIVELDGDVDEGIWRRILYTLRGDLMAPVGKIIITSRSKKAATFGTTKPLQLKFLHREAYWYFFKTIAFGSTNPQEQPKLLSIGMKIATEMNGAFLGANIVGGSILV